MGNPPPDDHVDTVRSFNRFYTNTIGALSDHLLDSPYTLTEVRVLFELAHRNGPDATELRHALGLDAGYLSRILARFDHEGLIERRPSERDRRRRILALTGPGREVFDDLDRRSSRQVAELLSALEPERRRRVVEAMRLIRSELGAEGESAPPTLRPLRPGDLGWVVWSQGAGYAEQFDWNEEYEALVARIVADFAAGHAPEREAGWIAEVDGRPVGSVFCVGAEATTAKLRLLWVEPDARGRGVGAALVRRCIAFAREAGYESMALWTVSMLLSARRLYEDAGFALETEEPVRMFGHDLVAQTWRLDLHPSSDADH